MSQNFPEGLLSCLALVAMLASGGLAKAQYIDCNANPTALAGTAFTANTSYPIQGACTGPIVIDVPSVTIAPYVNGGFTNIQLGPPNTSIRGYIEVRAPFFTLAGVVVDGSGLTNTAMPFGILIDGAADVSLRGVYVQNFAVGSGIVITGGSTVTLGGGQIADSAQCGLQINGPSMAVFFHGPEITGNKQGGICLTDGAVVTGDPNIHDNSGGPAVTLVAAQAALGGIVSSPAIDPTTNNPFVLPTILADESKLRLGGGTITGSGYANAIFATTGTSIQMQDTLVTDADGNDPTILVADGSSLVSLGGNEISNTATNGIAVEATNGSTFHQRIGPIFGNGPAFSNFYSSLPSAGDVITGQGWVQMGSNFELGTGKTLPSTWNGSIVVSQNSSFRMRGGMTINGSVSLTEGSNGFFKLTNNPGVANNVITGGVLCPFTTRQSSAVSTGNGAVVLTAGGSTSAVTFGLAPNNCLAF